MKKILSGILVFILLATSLLVLTGCDRGGESGGSSAKGVDKLYANAETGVLTDKWNGLEVKFAYPKDAGYEIEFTEKSVEFQRATLESKDLNARIQIGFDEVFSNVVESKKEDIDKKPEDYTDFQEVEYNGYKGYFVTEVDEKDPAKEGVLLLKEIEGDENEKWYALDITLKKENAYSKDVEFDPLAYFNEDAFQNLLKSITFTQIDKVEVDGVLGADREIVIKKLTAPEGYNVAQFPDTNGVMSAYMLPTGKWNSSGAYFRVFVPRKSSGERYGSLDEVLEYYSGHSFNYTFTDSNLAGQPVKVEHRPKATTTDAKYSVWDSGYFEKDGVVYNFLYYRYADVPEEVGTKLITDVLGGISFYSEE